MPPQIRSTKRSNDNDSNSDTDSPPSNNLWIGNLSSEITDSDLMDLFAKYGALDSLTLRSSRNYAFVFFKRVEDAVAAKEELQGVMMRGNPIRIQFGRPVYSDPLSFIRSRPIFHNQAKPCKNLWIGGIDPSVSKEEVEREFRKFGKIEDFRFLRNRNTASVQYARFDDASEAMRNLNGKQFGGEQIRVDFLRSHPSRRASELGDNTHDPKDGPPDVDSGLKRLNSQAPGVRKGEGQPSRVLWVGYPPSVQIDEQMLHNAMILFGEIESIKTFPSRRYAFVEFRSIDEARRAKEGLLGRLFNNPRITIMFSSSDLAPGAGRDCPGLYPGIQGPRPDMFFSEQSLRPSQMDMFGHGHPTPPRCFPGPLAPGSMLRPYTLSMHFEPLLSGPELGDLSSWRPPSPGIRSTTRTLPGSWDSYDERNPKRSRIDDRMVLGQQSYRLGPAIDGQSHHSPEGSKVKAGEYAWRGIIAKGGTPVCQARCVPIGKGLETELPEVINCSARTGLDMLTKHYAEAIGFDIVFFLPDSEDDFASYTEFLHYLAAKDRAGVAKFDNGTTLFLVPPSDILTKVLKVIGPERLYGVVLKLPQQIPNSGSVQQESHHSVSLSQYTDRRPGPSRRADYINANEEKVLPIDYNRVLHEESNFCAKPQFPPPESLPSQFTREYAPSNATSVSQSGVKLTSELIASLASILPRNSQSSSMESVGPSIYQSVAPNNEVPSPRWNQDHQASEPAGHSLQQFGSRFNPQTLQPQILHYSSTPSFGSDQFQDSSRTLSIPQNAYNPPSLPASRSYQVGVPPSTQKHRTDASAPYDPFFQPAQNYTGMPNQVYGVSFSQSQNVVPSSAEKVFVEAPNQAQQLQSDPGQGMPEEEADKNQRYQSTLQFAANLLLQIQQKQQQQTNTGGNQP